MATVVRVLLRSRMLEAGLQVGSEATSMLHVILALPPRHPCSVFHQGNNDRLSFRWFSEILGDVHWDRFLEEFRRTFLLLLALFDYEIVITVNLTRRCI